MKILKVERKYINHKGGWMLSIEDELTAAIKFDGVSFIGFSKEWHEDIKDAIWFAGTKEILHVLLGSDTATAITEAIDKADKELSFILSAEGKRIWIEVLDEHCCKSNPLAGGNRPCDSGMICEKCREQWVEDIYKARISAEMMKGGC